MTGSLGIIFKMWWKQGLETSTPGGRFTALTDWFGTEKKQVRDQQKVDTQIRSELERVRENITIVTGPVQRGVSFVVSQRWQRGQFRRGDAEQLAEPRRVATGCGQVDGGKTSGVTQQDRGFVLQQILNAFLLTTQQLKQK